MSAPTGDSGDALQRLQDEQWHILELFDSYARYQRDPVHHAAQASRLASLISTLLRVHCELEAMLLRVQPARDATSRAALADTDARRRDVLEALQRSESLSSRDPRHRQEMAVLAQRVRAWFQADEHGLCALLRGSRLDLSALDRQMAIRQEALLRSQVPHQTRRPVAQ
jgi:hypothetical protein